MNYATTATLAFPQAPSPLPPEFRGRMGFLNHDFQTAGDSRGFPDYMPRVDKNGLPETIKMLYSMLEKMDATYQHLWTDVFHFYSPTGTTYATSADRLEKMLAGNIAFTNNAGTDTNAWYPTKKNLYKADGSPQEPAKQETITCGGAMVITHGGVENINGRLGQGILMLDRQRMPSFNQLMTHPARDFFVHAATICRVEKVSGASFPSIPIARNGPYRVNPFDRNGGNKCPVLFAFGMEEPKAYTIDFMSLCCRVNYVPLCRFSPLLDSEYPVSPLVPTR